MSLHDKLTQKAIAMGKNPSEFTSASQKHANASWFYVIIAGVVWYFLGWEWALIPLLLGAFTAVQSISATIVATRLEAHKQGSEPANTDFTHIVQAYGKILETSAPVPGTVADVNKLPYPKQQIKNALVAALQNTDDSQMKKSLKIGYIQLSDWQEGVGESNQGVDFSSLDASQDTESLAQAVIEQSSGSEKWTKHVQKEQEELKHELQSLGLWE